MKKSFFTAQPLTNRAARRAPLRHAEAVRVATIAQRDAYTLLLQLGLVGADERAQALATYEKTVTRLVALLGPNAECYQVDEATWNCYWEWYKNEYNVRPRHVHVTLAEAKADMARESSPLTVADAKAFNMHTSYLRPDGSEAPDTLPMPQLYQEWMGCIAA